MYSSKSNYGNQYLENFVGEFIDRIEKVYRTEETLKITDVRIMNVANVLIYFSLGIYLDIIWPGKYGTQKTLYCWVILMIYLFI